MGCIDKMPYEVLLRNASFSECREYQKKNYSELFTVKPGHKIFDVHIIGIPPVYIALDGEDIIFPYTNPCHGTFLLKVTDPKEAVKIRGSKK